MDVEAVENVDAECKLEVGAEPELVVTGDLLTDAVSGFGAREDVVEIADELDELDECVANDELNEEVEDEAKETVLNGVAGRVTVNWGSASAEALSAATTQVLVNRMVESKEMSD